MIWVVESTHNKRRRYVIMLHFQIFFLSAIVKFHAQAQKYAHLLFTNKEVRKSLTATWAGAQLLTNIATKTMFVSVCAVCLLFAGYLVAKAVAPQYFDFAKKGQTRQEFVTQLTQQEQGWVALSSVAYRPIPAEYELAEILQQQNIPVRQAPNAETFTPTPSTHPPGVSVLLLEDIDAPLEVQLSEIFTFSQQENFEDVSAGTVGFTAGHGTQDDPSPLNGLSLERTDTTWAGRALPLSTVRQIVSQYDWNVEKALRIIFCESGRNPRAVNDNPKTRDYSIGLFQINLFQSLEDIRPSEEWLKDPINNVDYAYRLYKRLGWKPWKICGNLADQRMNRS